MRTYSARDAAALVFAVVVAFVGCTKEGGRLGDDCSGDSDCAEDYTCVRCSVRNSCYFDNLLDDDEEFEWTCKTYGSGAPTDSRYGGAGAGSGSSGSSGGSTGACAYFDSRLNRLLCGPNSTASSCSGKFLGAGSTCANFSCTSNSPSSCTSAGSNNGSGGSSSGSASCDASKVWTCAQDGQATPMCQWACTQSGTQRSQTCSVLASMTDNSAGACCTVCK